MLEPISATYGNTKEWLKRACLIVALHVDVDNDTAITKKSPCPVNQQTDVRSCEGRLMWINVNTRNSQSFNEKLVQESNVADKPEVEIDDKPEVSKLKWELECPQDCVS